MEDLWDFENTILDSRDSNYHKYYISKQFFKPTWTASKDLEKYLEPYLAKQFDTIGRKILRSGKETFAEPVTAKKWVEAAKDTLIHIA
jgi:hypothetical protein